ncbi:MAG: B12-binding domain-containing radical SAM protein [Caldilineaceae bacterium]|nr:B12-binding domain-containing radical SAM protein [Caldilineaceae bacterium]
MHLTFIKPNIGRMEHSLYVDEGRMEPLQLGVLAALTPPDVDIALWDDRLESIPYERPTDLVAITVETYTARRAYEIAGEYRRRGVPVVMGGMQPTLIPEEVKPHADSIFVGDAETKWAQVIDDARRGALQPVYHAPVGVAHPGIHTRRDIFKGKGYLPISLMQFSRGCRFACTFCAVSSYFDKGHYTRLAEEVVAEIEARERKQIIFFVDDNILSNFAAAKKLFRALIPLKIHWVSQGSIDMTQDRELMGLMVESGCVGMVVGFESISKDSLRWMRKSPNFVGGFDGYQKQIEVIREYGIQLWAAFTLGHDHDTVDSIRETLDWAMENKFPLAAFNILVPYPNTPLYTKLESEGRLLYDGSWWLHPEYRFNYAAFRPKNMTPDELTEACWNARSTYNSLGFLIRRAFDFKTNLRTLYKLGVYLRYSPIFRKEVFKKQGMRFGLG